MPGNEDDCTDQQHLGQRQASRHEERPARHRIRNRRRREAKVFPILSKVSLNDRAKNFCRELSIAGPEIDFQDIRVRNLCDIQAIVILKENPGQRRHTERVDPKSQAKPEQSRRRAQQNRIKLRNIPQLVLLDDLRRHLAGQQELNLSQGIVMNERLISLGRSLLGLASLRPTELQLRHVFRIQQIDASSGEKIDHRGNQEGP
ncbi:hypothetical protein [Bradyrhizobium sp. SYSU BS000235]|uniref:hypothetical protein n=1 Tax=Bradyrhizobium sp. SYSU BS000235 TaxID=3411332 RepID=UPI003C733387